MPRRNPDARLDVVQVAPRPRGEKLPFHWPHNRPLRHDETIPEPPPGSWYDPEEVMAKLPPAGWHYGVPYYQTTGRYTAKGAEPHMVFTLAWDGGPLHLAKSAWIPEEEKARRVARKVKLRKSSVRRVDASTLSDTQLADALRMALVARDTPAAEPLLEECRHRLTLPEGRAYGRPALPEAERLERRRATFRKASAKRYELRKLEADLARMLGEEYPSRNV